MYLSRVEIDTRNRQKIRDLTHLGAYHNWVEQSFPEDIAAGERPRHLWRLDGLGGKQYLLVLSDEKPDLSKLEKYGVPDSAQTRNYDGLLKSLKAGQTLQFRLTANPTHSVSRPGQRGQIYPEVTAMHQMQWLMKKSANYGFQLVKRAKDFSDEPESPANYDFDLKSRDRPMLHRRSGHGVAISRVSYEGMLTITDLTAFKQALTSGIGREKAFGMGLLTVIPQA